MLKILIDEEEVVSNKDFTINKEMLNTPSVILNNVYPKTWEQDKDYVSRFYHPKDFSKCKIIDETYIPPEEGTTVTSTTGEIYITDADNTKKDEYQVQGKCEQDTYSGKNKANTTGNPDWIYGNTQYEKNGATLIVKNNDTTASTKIYAYVQYNIDNLKPNTTYTISFDAVSTNNGVISLDVMKVRTTTTASDRLLRLDSSTSGHISGQFTTPADTSTMSMNIYSLRGTYYENVSVTYSNLQIEEGSSETSYEQWVGGIPAPNPGYPQEIRTVSGIENLFDKNTANILNAYLNNNTNKIYSSNSTRTTYISCKPNTTYTISKILSSRFVVAYTTDIPVNGSDIRGAIDKSNYTNITITTDSNANYLCIYFYHSSYDTTITVDDILSTIQIEEGTIIHQYVPYGHWLPIKVQNKNLFDGIWELGIINANTGQNADNANRMRNKNYIQVEELTNYKFSFDTTAFTQLMVYEYKEDYSYNLTTNKSVNLTGYLTTNAGTRYIRFRPYTSGAYTDLTLKGQMEKGTTATDYTAHQEQTTLIDMNKYDSSNNIVGNYELCSIGDGSIGDVKDLLNIKDGSAIITKNIDKYVANNNSSFYKTGTYDGLYHLSASGTPPIPYTSVLGISNCFVNNPDSTITANASANTNLNDGQFAVRWSNTTPTNRDRIYFKYLSIPNDVDAFKTLMLNNNLTIYYQRESQTITLNGTYNINLYNGINHITIYDDDLMPTTQLHYNYVEEQTITDLLFCGIVKNSGNISLNPRDPHYSTLQILDFKDFLSTGETLDFVIANKTIQEALEQVIFTISDYGFILGNINILNPNEIIGAYSTKDKSAYDVFNYIADITQSRWTTRVIDENTIAIDFYDPTLMVQGTPINYTQEFFKNKLIDNMEYSYGTNDYRNKQVMTSKQVYSNISQTQSIVANGYQTQFNTEQPIGQIISITVDGINQTIATSNEKSLGFTADIYYTPGNNYFESADLISTGEIIIIEYIAVVEGRQIITNASEVNRVADSTGRKGTVARYENRNDATTSNELQLIGQSYIKYKGTPEIILTINSRSNSWEVGQRVQFNAPIDELNTEYMVRSKKVNYIASIDTIFYTYELTSSFNSETAINYFDNQRAKANGNIGEGEFISRNVDIESAAEIIFYDTEINEVTLTGDNTLNSILNSPIIN